VRIMSLNDMLAELRSEARISANVAHGAHLLPGHIALLRRVQEEVYSAYDWPSVQATGAVEAPAGARYLAYPTNIAFGGVREVYAKKPGCKWQEISFGITPEHLNEYDSDDDERAPDVRAWANYASPDAEIVNQNMFEVWPIPDVDTKLRFHGRMALRPLADVDTDHSTVDGPIIVLHAAAEILAGQRAEDASLKLQKATGRYALLRQTQNAVDNRKVNMASHGSPSGSRRRGRQGLDYI